MTEFTLTLGEAEVVLDQVKPYGDGFHDDLPVFVLLNKARHIVAAELPPIPKLADNECRECEGIPCKCEGNE
jgi:hypothetical protein